MRTGKMPVEGALDAVEKVAMRLATDDEDPAMVRYVLSRRRPTIWGDREKIEVTGKDGQPIDMRLTVPEPITVRAYRGEGGQPGGGGQWPNNQIQIKWSNAGGRDYDASLDGLRMYDPKPEIKTSIRIRGIATREVLDQLVGITGEHGLDIDVALTATWDDDVRPSQLRLFPMTVMQHALAAAEGGNRLTESDSEAAK